MAAAGGDTTITIIPDIIPVAVVIGEVADTGHAIPTQTVVLHQETMADRLLYAEVAVSLIKVLPVRLCVQEVHIAEVDKVELLLPDA